MSSLSMAWRNAASVLPDPVGAMTSAWLPPAIASQAPSCASVGSANDASNHPRVAAEKRSRAVTCPFCARPRTTTVSARAAGAGDDRGDVDLAAEAVGPPHLYRHLGHESWRDDLHHGGDGGARLVVKSVVVDTTEGERRLGA